MIQFTQKGNFTKTWAFLERCREFVGEGTLNRLGEAGVQALREATPKRTGKTAASWYYRIARQKSGVSIEWRNSNIVDGTPVAIVLQYGHANQNGTYIQGRDYINPALRPVFDEMADSLWKEAARK